MPFCFREMGELVATDPKEAKAQLSVLLFEHNYSVPKVAKALVVSKQSIYRWCKRLEAEGYGDPRAGVRERGPGRPRSQPEPVV